MENMYRDIIMTGCVAEKGTDILASKYEHDGETVFPVRLSAEQREYIGMKPAVYVKE